MKNSIKVPASAVVYPFLLALLASSVFATNLDCPRHTYLASQAPHELALARSTGRFVPYPADLAQVYLAAHAKRGLGAAPKSRKIEASDLRLHLATASDGELRALRNLALAHLEKGTGQPVNALISNILTRRGYKTGKFGAHYFPSASGNWRRGGRAQKILFPINIGMGLEETEVARLVDASSFLTLKEDRQMEALQKKIGGRPTSADLEKYIRALEVELQALVVQARKNPNVLSPNEIHPATVALISALTGRFFLFDWWTARSGHSAVQEGLAELRRGIGRRYHPEDDVNRLILAALRNYLETSEEIGEAMILGDQLEVHPIDPIKSLFRMDLLPNGPGAGDFLAALDRSWRTQNLFNLGVDTTVFSNVEVTSLDPLADLGAFFSSGKKVAVGIVQKRPEDAGGGPRWVTLSDGSEVMQLIEGEDDGDFFNTNTILVSLRSREVAGFGFETRMERGQPLDLVKVNAGNVTIQEPADFFLQPRTSYQHLKSVKHYLVDGPGYVANWQAMAERVVRNPRSWF